MYRQFLPKINLGDKLIIGIGDSFTQGVGAYPIDVWKKHKGTINCLDPELMQEMLSYMYENSWVNQLCKNHLTDYKSINLGVMGTGNRSAVKELFLNVIPDLDKASDVIVIFLMTGMERFDFVNRDFSDTNHFYTMWPNPQDVNSTNKKLWECYAREIWSDRFVIIETIINIVDVQNYCKSRGYTLILSSAFDYCLNKKYFESYLDNDSKYLVDLVDWDNFLNPKGCNSFLELLLRLDGETKETVFRSGFYHKYSKLKFPTKYITPCIHPTLDGHKVISEEFFNFIKQKGLCSSYE